MPSAGFEPASPAIDRLQTHYLDRTATGISTLTLFICFVSPACLRLLCCTTLMSPTKCSSLLLDCLVYVWFTEYTKNIKITACVYLIVKSPLLACLLSQTVNTYTLLSCECWRYISCFICFIISVHQSVTKESNYTLNMLLQFPTYLGPIWAIVGENQLQEMLMTHTYIYIYMCVCVCVYVYVCACARAHKLHLVRVMVKQFLHRPFTDP